jgi:hypothetical protein
MTSTAVQSWTGRSDAIAVPLLGAEFWAEGREVAGVYEGWREQKVGGPAIRLTLERAVVIDSEEVEEVELPSLTGVRNALQNLREQGYKPTKGDKWRVECVAIKKAKKEGFSDSPQFQIDVMRG